MLVTTHAIRLANGSRFLIETGAPLDELRDDLRQWVIFLLGGLPLVALISIGGGYVLIRRALTPVDRIAATAERITSHNLGERLPIARTGDGYLSDCLRMACSSATFAGRAICCGVVVMLPS